LFLFAKICIFAAILYFQQSWQRGEVKSKNENPILIHISRGIGEMLGVKIEGFSTESFTPMAKVPTQYVLVQ
jgi:hypothetical protein